MYHLLVSYSNWPNNCALVSGSRCLTYTDQHIVEKVSANGTLNIEAIRSNPALFVTEHQNPEAVFARIGYIHAVRKVGKDYEIQYYFEESIDSLPNNILSAMSIELGVVNNFEWNNSHWAVKDVDLFKALYKVNSARPTKNPYFDTVGLKCENKNLISVMMPFNDSCKGVFESIESAANIQGLECKKADNVWEHHSIIQDIITLICISKIVICDCTGRNANVFYETGIAHALGKNVILITQNLDDIPFDLKHLRVVRYLNNDQGLSQLVNDLSPRINYLINN
ncbi:hypothetical protein [Paraglaciecola hydrolytica]|uniref:Nucleoside 2-deoxyribosyltransferase n=1 Tax=Paraglaciecola hydrolytica TaxID=1799789 RepID=A0A135ZZI0_9ALTE|nr:hypothetical protein [Paraglaciecola hydrolytica]KXI28384.1 hypothetical protein AX660_18660 [Paraglaciecola hydrolytica]